MPIYTYKCLDCKETFDLLEGVNQQDKVSLCPKCQSKNLEKQISTFGIGTNSGSKGDNSGSCSTGSCPTCPTCF